jgi:hypothetical protein
MQSSILSINLLKLFVVLGSYITLEVTHERTARSEGFYN